MSAGDRVNRRFRWWKSHRARVGPALWVMASLVVPAGFSVRAQQPSQPRKIDLATAGTVGLTIAGATGSDQLTRVSIADVNGDGLPDVVAAAPLATDAVNGRFRVGAVYVVFGGIDRAIGGTLDLATRADVVIVGAESDDRFGVSLATGDVTGDGIADILVGAPRAAGLPDSRAQAGRIYVIYGGPHLVPGTRRDMAGIVAPGADLIVFGAEAGDHLGSSLALTDLTGDGIQDIVAASANASPQGTRFLAGTIYALFGGVTMLSGQFRDLAEAPPRGADLVILGPSVLGFFGFQVAVGDVNGDRLPDIVVSAPLGDGPKNERTDAGEVYVVLGSLDLQRGGVRDLATATPQGADVILYGGAKEDLFGFTLMVADVTGDGVDDIVTSAVQADGPEAKRASAGEVYIFFGGADMKTGAVRDVAGQAGPPADVRIFGAEAGDEMGTALAVGDVNGNQLPDLLIGAPLADGDKNERPDAGEVYVYLDGRLRMSGTTLDVGGEATAQPDAIFSGAVGGDQLGAFIAFGDVDGDRGVDLLLSAPTASAATRFNNGAILVLFRFRL